METRVIAHKVGCLVAQCNFFFLDCLSFVKTCADALRVCFFFGVRLSGAVGLEKFL